MEMQKRDSWVCIFLKQLRKYYKTKVYSQIDQGLVQKQFKHYLSVTEISEPEVLMIQLVYLLPQWFSKHMGQIYRLLAFMFLECEFDW